MIFIYQSALKYASDNPNEAMQKSIDEISKKRGGRVRIAKN